MKLRAFDYHPRGCEVSAGGPQSPQSVGGIEQVEMTRVLTKVGPLSQVTLLPPEVTPGQTIPCVPTHMPSEDRPQDRTVWGVFGRHSSACFPHVTTASPGAVCVLCL